MPPARPSTTPSSSSSPDRGDAGDRREETVAAFDIEGLRGMIAAVHDELRSRGIAGPQPARAAASPIPRRR